MTGGRSRVGGLPPLQLLLSDANEGGSALPAGLRSTGGTGQEKPPKQVLPDLLWNDGKDPGSLPEQRWGLIVPAGDEGKRLQDLITPLSRRRQQEQGDQPIRVFEAPARATAAEALAWRKTVFDDGTATRETLPRYQLVLGNLDQVALSIQQALAIDGFVGRLAFDNPDHYRAYAEKVLSYEDGTAPIAASRAAFFASHDGSPAVSHGYENLVNPALRTMQSKQLNQTLQARELIELGDGDARTPLRDLLLEYAARPDPALLFTMSHGAGRPKRDGWASPQDQRQRQGAMQLREGLLLGRDLATRPFMPGGVWFMFACYGAGVPEKSAYFAWLDKLEKLGQFDKSASSVLRGLVETGGRPFISALPQAVLQNPQGPLAFFGHVDLAWSYSYQDLDSGQAMSRPGKFMQVVSDLLHGYRVGIGFASLMRALAGAHAELSTLYDDSESPGPGTADPESDARRAHLWMLRQDLQAFVLLGDPAVRLPIQDTAPVVQTNRPPSQSAAATATTTASAAPATAAPAQDFSSDVSATISPDLLADLERYERAIAEVLLNPGDLARVASDCELPRSRLAELVSRYREGGRTAIAPALRPSR